MRGRQLKRDVATNLVFAVAKVLALFGMVSLCEQLIPAAIGAFLLSRRFGLTTGTLIQLGSSQTIVRYVSMNQEDAARKTRFVALGILLAVSLALLVLPVAYFGRQAICAWLLPGQPDAERLVFWSLSLSVAMVPAFVSYAIYLAERKVFLTNFLELTNGVGFLTLAMVLWPVSAGNELAAAANWMCFTTLCVGSISSVAIVVYLARYGTWQCGSGSEWKATLLESLGYGIPRGLTASCDMGLLLVGPWLLRHDSQAAGHLLMAFMILRAIQNAITPAARMAGVLAAKYTSQNDQAAIADGARLIAGTTVYSAVLGTMFVAPWLGDLLSLWLGNGVADDVLRLTWWVLPTVTPVALFHALKGIIDTRWFQPLNLYALAAALACQVILGVSLPYVLPLTTAVGISIVVSFWLLGLLSIRNFLDELSPLSHWGVPRLLVTATVIAAINIGLARLEWFVLFFPLAAACSLAVVLLILQVPSRPPFVDEVWQFLRPRSTAGT